MIAERSPRFRFKVGMHVGMNIGDKRSSNSREYFRENVGDNCCGTGGRSRRAG